MIITYLLIFIVHMPTVLVAPTKACDYGATSTNHHIASIESDEPKCIAELYNPHNIFKTPCDVQKEKLSIFSPLYVGYGTILGVQNEADLILSRAGIFDWDTYNLDKIHVCKEHYKILGQVYLKSKPKSTRRSMPYIICAAPEYLNIREQSDLYRANPHSATKKEQLLNKEESLFLLNNRDTFLPTGTILCPRHKTFIGDLLRHEKLKRQGENITNELVYFGYEHVCEVEIENTENIPSDNNNPTLTHDDQEANNENSESTAAHPQHIDHENYATFETDYFKTNIREIAKAAGIQMKNLHFSDKFHQLTSRSKQQYSQNAKKICTFIVKTMAQKGHNELQQLMESNYENSGQRSQQLQTMLTVIADSYSNAPDANVRRQLLSIVAPLLHYNEIKHYIPNISLYEYKIARRHAMLFGSGTLQQPQEVTRERCDKKKIESFIAFITSPHIAVDLPYGTATVTTKPGIKHEIPNLVRLMVDQHIIDQYYAYLIESNSEHLSLSKSTLQRILKACTASTRKSVQGLDYFTFAGIEAFQTINNIVANLNVDSEWKNTNRQKLLMAKQYLQKDYKTMVRPQSNIADHCITFALSDKTKPSLQQHCTHKHNEVCSSCHNLHLLLDDIKTTITETTFETQLQKNTAIFDFDNAMYSILQYKQHLLRTVHQNEAKTEILQNMQENDVHLHLDWAMKWLPATSREPQSEFFGKRGIPWHITVATMKEGMNKYKTHTFVHVFDNSPQDSEAVIAIIRDVLVRLQINYLITGAYITSDNAACYHGSQTIAAMAAMLHNTGVLVKAWHFTEVQSGKGPCDRAAANIKTQIRMYIAENHKCTTAQEFAQCATQHDRIKCTTFVYSAIEKPSTYEKASIAGIAQYNNFGFSTTTARRIQITAWKAYKIGIGDIIPQEQWQNQGLTEIDEIKYYAANPIIHNGYSYDWRPIKITHDPNYAQTNTDEESMHEHTNTEQNEPPTNINKQLFYCPEDGCTKVYQYEAYLTNHLLLDKHHYHHTKQTLRENAIESYEKYIKQMEIFEKIPKLKEAINTLINAEEITTTKLGWALRTQRQVKQFSPKITTYLRKLFDDGIRNKRKMDPKEAAALIKKDAQFEQSEWLTTQQIKSFWSREAFKKRNQMNDDSKLPIDNNDDNEQEDDYDQNEHDITLQQLKEQLFTELDCT